MSLNLGDESKSSQWAGLQERHLVIHFVERKKEYAHVPTFGVMLSWFVIVSKIATSEMRGSGEEAHGDVFGSRHNISNSLHFTLMLTRQYPLQEGC